ncbi:hypothetical protein J2S74_002561 [Evansella vedderi]|uniref:Uncharacterized protein n=2 Tax=Evansella vedderi TaxID=38282 RepID=A0ABT9ZVB6_9BACI|nr:hypothetical protein [Evansella vedderi]
MIIHQMYSFIAPWMFQNYFDSVMAGTASPLFGMTSGEMFQLFNNIPFTIECIAYFFLVIGIYRLWRNKMT